MRRTRLCALCVLTLAVMFSANRAAAADLSRLVDFHRLPPLPNEHGVAGPFVGVHNDALIVAGGANFPQGVPWHPTEDGGKSIKTYHDAIHVLVKNEKGTPLQTADGSPVKNATRYRWVTVSSNLSKAVAYGVSIPTPDGLICIGGERQEHAPDDVTGEVESTLHRSADVFLLKWDPKKKQIEVTRQLLREDEEPDAIHSLPNLPVATTAACGALVGDFVYVVGGDSGEGGNRNFWRLDLNGRKKRGEKSTWQWQRLPSWDGPPRSHAIAVEQAESLFLLSGRNKLSGRGFEILTDAYRFDPAAYAHERSRAKPDAQGQLRMPSYANGWTRLADIAPDGESPRCVMAGTASKSGYDFLLVYGGARGDVLLRREEELPKQIEAAQAAGDAALAAKLTEEANALYDNHAGFSRDILAYHLTTDKWTTRGQMPDGSPVTTTAVAWGDATVLASGEKFPGVRTRDVWLISPNKKLRSFGTANWCVLGVYLGLLVAMGFYFARREKTSDDFFLAGGRVPWWAAGLSIFATMLSAITYLAIPARAYGTNWSWFILNMGIPVVAVIVVFLYLPFFRRIQVASAYDYLERRFHVSVRLFGAVSFILYQLGRMGIVVLLPALALSAVTGLNVYVCIVVMGLLSTVYTVLGGIEAVIWTDVVQVIVLVGGAVAALVIMAVNIDGGLGAMVSTAWNAGKLDLIGEFRFHDLSWAKDGILVILLAALFNNLLPYTSDQAIIQRYLTVATEREARRAIWTNGLLVIPASILFFFVGTALWTFYQAHPAALVPLDKPNQIFPWFIAQEVPAGLAGLIIAGVFAAAMSSLDSSMHSVATIGTTDFYDRFGRKKEKEESLRVARRLTVILGIVGTGSAAVMAGLDVKHLWDLVLNIVGLFLGTLGGLFAMGIFSSRATTLHAWLGAVAAIATLIYCQFATDLNGLLNGAIAMGTCVGVGVLSSWLIPVGRRCEKELTIHSLLR